MKRSVSLLVAAVLALGACAPQVDLESEEAAVKTVLDQIPQVLATEDMELFSQLVAHDPDIIIFGTDAAERWVGYEAFKEAMEAQFAAVEESQLALRDRVIRVHSSGAVAWFSEVWDWDVTVAGEAVSIEGMRVTGVLEKRNGSWVLVQWHGSIPVAGQAFEY